MPRPYTVMQLVGLYQLPLSRGQDDIADQQIVTPAVNEVTDALVASRLHQRQRLVEVRADAVRVMRIRAQHHRDTPQRHLPQHVRARVHLRIGLV